MMSGAEGGTDVRNEPRRPRALLDGSLAVPENRLMDRRSNKTMVALQAQIAERDRRIADLEARNSELEHYAYTVSHDLKTPLVTIKGFINFLQRDIRNGDQERVHHDLERISYAADRMQHLLDDLLELARVGRVGKKLQQMAFSEVIDEALERVADAIEERAAEIRIGSSLPEVYGDRSLLVDVVEKLLDNAVRHIGDQPAPCVEVGARRRGDPSEGRPGEGSQETVFFVRDNGPGIHPRHHDKVFRLFERLDPEKSAGTGVGLTLVKRIIDFHGGKIWIESSGRGSTVCFALPGARSGS